MFDPSSFVKPTHLAHADASRDVLPRGGTSKNDSSTSCSFAGSSNPKDGLKSEKIIPYSYSLHPTGDCEGSVVRESCLLQERLERDGRITGHHLPGRLLSVLHRGRKPAHLRNPACLPPPQITQAAQSHQQGSRTETGGPDSALLSQTHRKHCAHLLHVLHHLWHFGRPAVQGQLVLLRRPRREKSEESDRLRGGRSKPMGEPTLQLRQPWPGDCNTSLFKYAISNDVKER
ncbi:hypothetical protein TNCV_3083521 [Trichonephila clavipes]|nr:hypothetical protein TNCV_3083521 [Trichonephila clavipes]